MSDLAYTIKENDRSIEQIRDKEKFYDFNPVYPRNLSQKYIDFSDEVLLNQPIIGNFAYKPATPNIGKIKSSGKLWKELGIDLQDVEYIKEGNDNLKFKGKFDEKFCKALDISSPLDIPIKFIDDYLETHVDALHITMKDTGNIIIFKKVFLPKLEDKINSVIYAHELTHAELNDAGGGIKEYIHKETIPIFVEQLFADKINPETFELCRNNRLATVAAGIEEMKNNKKMNFKTRIELETYLISTFQAMNLSNVYFGSNDKVKREMINYLNRLFKGEAITEDMLEQFDSQFDGIEPSLKNLQKIKKIKNTF